MNEVEECAESCRLNCGALSGSRSPFSCTSPPPPSFRRCRPVGNGALQADAQGAVVRDRIVPARLADEVVHRANIGQEKFPRLCRRATWRNCYKTDSNGISSVFRDNIYSTVIILAGCHLPPSSSRGRSPCFFSMSCAPNGDCGVMMRISCWSCTTSVPPARGPMK